MSMKKMSLLFTVALSVFIPCCYLMFNFSEDMYKSRLILIFWLTVTFAAMVAGPYFFSQVVRIIIKGFDGRNR